MVVYLYLEELDVEHVERGVRERECESASRERGLQGQRILAVCANGGRRGRGVGLRSLGVPCRMFVFQEKVARALVCEAAERVNACTRGVRKDHAPRQK
jgi:hypothetical protein